MSNLTLQNFLNVQHFLDGKDVTPSTKIVLEDHFGKQEEIPIENVTLDYTNTPPVIVIQTNKGER